MALRQNVEKLANEFKDRTELDNTRFGAIENAFELADARMDTRFEKLESEMRNGFQVLERLITGLAQQTI